MPFARGDRAQLYQDRIENMSETERGAFLEGSGWPADEIAEFTFTRQDGLPALRVVASAQSARTQIAYLGYIVFDGAAGSIVEGACTAYSDEFDALLPEFERFFDQLRYNLH